MHYRSRIKGFSIVELMVAVVIGLIGSVIVFQVYSTFEGQKRSITTSGDAQGNIAIATNAIEHAARHSGYGINFDTHLGCDVVIFRQYAKPPTPPAVADAGTLSVIKLVPVFLKRHASGRLESITFTGSNHDSAYSVTKNQTEMGDTLTDFKVQNMYGVEQGDLLILAEKKDTGVRANKITCAAMEAQNLLPNPAPAPPARQDTVQHLYGSYTRPETPAIQEWTYYNKNGGLQSLDANAAYITAISNAYDLPMVGTAADRFKFKPGANVMNVGRPRANNPLGLRSSTFSIDADPDGNNNRGRLLENGAPLVDGIVFMDAQYGLVAAATPNSDTVTYVKNMPEDATKDPKVAQSDWFRIRTVRMVLIARVGQYEKEVVSPASYTVWSGALSTTYTVPTADRNYRHRVIELVIPIRNMFWRPK